MKHSLYNRSWLAAAPDTGALGLAGAAILAAFLLLFPSNLRGQSTPNGIVVSTLSGGGPFPFYGYVDGNTANLAQFHTPIGLAMDTTGGYLFVADRDNNAVRMLDLAAGQTYTFVPIDGLTPPGAIANPVGVTVDADDNLYVLNRGNGNDGTITVFDYYGDFVGTLAQSLTNANSFAMDDANNLYVTVNTNKVMQITPGGVKTTVATVTSASAFLQGIVVMDDGRLAVVDSGRHGIYLINPASGIITTNTGFNGPGDYTGVNNRGAVKATAKFNQPYGLAKAGNGILVVSDYGNNRVKVVNAAGTVTNLYGVNSALWCVNCNPHCTNSWPGWYDGPVTVPDACGDVEAREPRGVVIAANGLIYVTEDYYHLIRTVTGANLPPVPPPPPPPPAAPIILTVLTNYGQVFLAWSAPAGATSYNVKRSPSNGGPYTTIANRTITNYTDTTVINGTTYYYVISAIGAGGEGTNSAQISATPPLPPVPDPIIGYVDFPSTTLYTSVMHPVSSFVLNNDAPIVIQGAAGSQTFYTYGATTASNSIPDPTSASASAPVGYQDGLYPSQVAYYTITQILPDLTIKAIGEKPDGSPNSAIVKARFQFITANPLISGNNAAKFAVADITANAQMWYTVDGSDPTNASPSVGPIASGTALSLQFPPGASNLTFKVIAVRTNYQASAIVPAIFSATNFVPNSISLGFATGEASSDFIGSPGQIFYAPVTLSPLPDAKIYSLQFNVTVTNAGGNPGPTVIPGAHLFQSMLKKPDLKNPGYFLTIPPAMFLTSATNPQPVVPPTNQVIQYNNGWFEPLTFSDNSLNLLGVGWLERYNKTNLYDTTAQTLIDYSEAHDTLFTPALGKVVLGGYAFLIPTTATAGQTYRIQIARPSATSDGIGSPGSDVYIAAPTNGSLTVGAMNSIKVVTVGQRKYIAGDCAPFRWFNAGDYGNTNLDNSDVEQVFQSAIYGLNYPPLGSDFLDSMDSCGRLGVITPNGYYIGGSTITDPATLNLLFDGNDTTINQIPFGDGFLDVCDVYVTFRRSLDPSLTWWQRYWTNGVLAAVPMAQPKDAGSTPKLKVSTAFLTNPPSINFAAGDALTSAGTAVSIPITARIFGDYPLRLLMLSLSVEPLDGSPPLASSIQFNPNPALGSPSLTASKGNGNYSATWLNNAIGGLTGDATLGTLTVAVPANAPSSAAYAVHFDHASASPNGLAPFPKQTLTGLILLSNHAASIYNDSIPDSWRLRYFGTIHNILAQADADADGDGTSNWHEYMAGTDPTDPKSVLRASTDRTAALGALDCVIRWPSINAKRYLVERSTSPFNPSWIPVCTNTGTGRDMEFHDTTGGQTRFYRVRVAQ